MPIGFHGLGRGAIAAAGRLDQATVAYLDAMTSPQTDQAAVRDLDRFVRRLKEGGAWDKLDLLYRLYGHDDQATRLNLIAPAGYALTKVNSPLFTAWGGWADNGGAGYLDSGFNISSAVGRKYAQDDAGFGVGVLSTGKSGNACAGAGANALVIACTVSDVLRFRINQTANRDFAGMVSTPKGVTGVDRTGANSVQAYRAGVGGSTVGTSVAPGNDTFKVLTNNGVSFSGQTVGLAWCGQALGATHQQLMRDAWVEYVTARGGSPE